MESLLPCFIINQEPKWNLNAIFDMNFLEQVKALQFTNERINTARDSQISCLKSFFYHIKRNSTHTPELSFFVIKVMHFMPNIRSIFKLENDEENKYALKTYLTREKNFDLNQD